jgi:hypothetical protein
MGLRFRQSFKLFPGVRLNLSKSGISASFGAPGATLNIAPRRLRSTVGIPGTGLSYQTQHSFSSKRESPPKRPRSDRAPAFNPNPNPSPPPAPLYWQAEAMREIGSASVEQLTSDSLRELRNMIADARSQRSELEDDLRQARALHLSQTSELARRQRSLFRYF